MKFNLCICFLLLVIKVAIVSATLAVLLLISSSLVATAVRRFDTKKITISSPGISSNVSICDFLIRENTDYKCTHVILGMVSF